MIGNSKIMIGNVNVSLKIRLEFLAVDEQAKRFQDHISSPLMD